MRGAGGTQGTLKRRWLWPFTWLPRPRAKRPLLSCWMSHACMASTMGTRGKAMVTEVAISSRSVAFAASVAASIESCAVSATLAKSKPSSSARLAPSAFPPGQRTPIWSNDDFAVYAPDGAVPPIMPASAPPLSVRMSSVSIDDSRLAFTATLADDAARRWTGQDWVILAADDSPWALPRDLGTDGRSYVAAQWFAGQFHPGQGVISKRYVFDARAASLSLEIGEGRLVSLETSENGLGPGVWTLALRLRHNWWEAAVVPVVRLTIAEDGAATFAVYEESLGVTPIP